MKSAYSTTSKRALSSGKAARRGKVLPCSKGLVICGKCGRRMTLRYHQRGGRLSPDYVCQKQCVEECRPLCQNVPGGVVDDALSALIVDSISPLALEVALNVQQQLQERLAEADCLRRQVVERAQYEAEQARIRYMRVDPNNRLVADTLEALWNDKLRQRNKRTRSTKNNAKTPSGQSPKSRRLKSWS